MKLRIGHLSTFYHTAILLMAKSGIEILFDHEIEWRLMGTGPAIMQAFLRHELDLAYIGLPPAMIGIDLGVPVKCVAGGHMEGTVLAGKAACRGFQDEHDDREVLHQFRGKKIGVPGRGSIHDVILRHYIDEFGLAGDIEIVNYAWADLVTEAIVRNEVAAAMGTPALAAAIRRFAGGKILLPPSRLWPDNPSYGIVAHHNLLNRQASVILDFLRLHEEATAFLRERPGEAARIIAEFVGVADRDLVLDALTISPRYCAHITEAYVRSTLQFIPVLMRQGFIKAEMSEDRIFFRELINRVHPGKDHYNQEI